MKKALVTVCLLGVLLVGCTTTWVDIVYQGTVSAYNITPLGEVATNIGVVYFDDGRVVELFDLPKLEIGRQYIITAKVPANGNAAGRIVAVRLAP